ncbi:unnamed protein product, partial [Iphiclides podalirius]
MKAVGGGARPVVLALTTLMVVSKVAHGAPQETTQLGFSPEEAACLRVFDDECTWCVALYREGGDASRGQRTGSGLYCGGALVGGRVVLTAAMCALKAPSEAVRARVPASADPRRDYAVGHTILRHNNATGTYAKDFALMVLTEDVQWDLAGNNGACLELRKPMGGDCVFIKFTTSEQFVMSPLSVRDGRCRNRRTRGEGVVACGTAEAGQCDAAVGAPVLCPITSDDQGGMSLAGVIRKPCSGDSVLISKVQMHADWFNQELQRLGLQPISYYL